ncbi:hypothetical protein EV189_2258 [Motilibacter rhizosphaerae]|uniref:Uncharacterized protein n=1 Tax=Motilibacter rhizosphaerae TaxID=598652 RepID=A0A4Q7NP29_9ACTN|nr:hypothetical protein [Motilibacter rhizosphaerae]RZS86842.1 hypothetical protein EV189_2258 [Motilibacter rhizosphaerae]
MALTSCTSCGASWPSADGAAKVVAGAPACPVCLIDVTGVRPGCCGSPAGAEDVSLALG